MKTNIKPPRLADKIFLWYCKRASSEDMHGDVEELFYKDLQQHTRLLANVLYWRRIFSLMFSYAVKQRKQKASHHMYSSNSFSPVMLRNYFKTASRNLAKNRLFTVLNVLGLALGMSITLLFIAMLSFIFRYDDFHVNGDQIYRVTTRVKDKNDNPQYASAPAALVQKLTENFSGIEKVIPIEGSLQGEAVYLQKEIYLHGYFTTPEFLSVFNFPLLKGNASTALNDPNSIVITEREAIKIFGSKEPMGEIIRLEPYGDFIVTGILKDPPKNSHLYFDVLASYQTWTSFKGNAFLEGETSWLDFMNSYVYLVLADHTKAADVNTYLNRVAEEAYRKPESFTASFELQALNDIVPGPPIENSPGITWDYLSIILVGLITIIILVPACANYVNLAISQSLNRMKEIGVRKVMGGQKSQIFFQFIMETTLTMLLALVLSYFIFDLIRGEYLSNFGSPDTMDLTPTPLTVIYFILFALLVGFIAGVVPAFYFSRLQPVVALKGKPQGETTGVRFSIRNIVITVQFILSLGFIMAVVIMFQQYNYSVNYDFGFEQQHTLDVELQGVDPQLFKSEFEQLSAVQRVSMSSHILGLGSGTVHVLTADRTDSLETSVMSVDENFISNLKLTLLAGKDFSDRATHNANMIIVNEEFIKKLNIHDVHAAIDQPVVLSDGREFHIGAVVKNFHYASLRAPIGSFFFEYNPKYFQYANLRVSAGTHFNEIAAMEDAWKKIGGDNKFQAQFFEDEIKEAFSFYFLMVKLWGFLGLLAITVTCLGLLGTVVFTIKNRLKEVSIRKVMGASSGNVMMLLSRNFIIMILIASFITIPGIYFMFQHWLLPSVQHYSVSIGFFEILVSLLLMMVLGLATILSQTWKASTANPVDNLRSE